MDLRSTAQLETLPEASLSETWDGVCGLLRQEMSRSEYETWVQPLTALSCSDGILKIGTINSYGRDIVDTRLKSKIRKIASGLLKRELRVEVVVIPSSGLPAPAAKNGRTRQAQPTLVEPQEAPPVQEEAAAPTTKYSPRKLKLVRAYGSKRAAVIKPEKTIYTTHYFFFHWVPLIGHSAMTVIMAARAMCFWDMNTGEKRNQVETSMAELAEMASVSVRTVKDVLKMDLVRAYFLRYTVRRVQTSYGVRTAGIILKVRMDDPLTPHDQTEHDLPEDPRWYADPNMPSLFDDEEED